MEKIKEIKLTENQKVVLQTLTVFEKPAYAKEVNSVLTDRTFNSVNATLASLASKGLVKKDKGVFDNKLLTNYELTDLGKATIAE